MRHILIFLITCCFGFTALSQNRIGLDVSTRFQGANFTFNYHHLIKRNYLLSFGAYYGSNGNTSVIDSPQFLEAGNRKYSPYAAVNADFIDNSGTRHLLSYKTSGVSYGLALGLGAFYQFNLDNSIRANLFTKVGRAETRVKGKYYSIENVNRIENEHTVAHFVAAFSAEAFHVVQLNPKLAFYYGVKVPFYFSVDKSVFNPRTLNDLYYGFEPEFSAGLTFAFGDCDQATVPPQLEPAPAVQP
jgi:hypothetical protein